MGRTTESLLLAAPIRLAECTVEVQRQRMPCIFPANIFSKQKFRFLRVIRTRELRCEMKSDVCTAFTSVVPAFILFIEANAIWFHCKYGFWVLLFGLIFPPDTKCIAFRPKRAWCSNAETSASIMSSICNLFTSQRWPKFRSENCLIRFGAFQWRGCCSCVSKALT